MSIPTPHIAAKTKIYLVKLFYCRDPLRAKFIAETYLTDVTQVNGS